MTYPVPGATPAPEGDGTPDADELGSGAALEPPADADDPAVGAAVGTTVTVERIVVGIHVLIVMTETWAGAYDVAGRAAAVLDAIGT